MRVAARVVLASLAGAASCAWAHSFDERYDLPLPLAYFVVAAAAAVALTFVLAAIYRRHAPGPGAGGYAPAPSAAGPPPLLLRMLGRACRALALCLFILAVAAAFFGSGDPLMNLAPTLIWIVWWIGLSLLVACIGNIWPVLDPWRTLFDIADGLVRRLGRKAGITPVLSYPRALGAWPAVALLLLWSWLELVYPLASVPQRVAWASLAWSVLTLAGMVCFGREAWQRNADVFALYFSVLGRFAPLGLRAGGRGLAWRAPGAGLLSSPENAPTGIAHVAFVIAMLATVLFDGLRGGAAWGPIDAALGRAVPGFADINGYVSGTLGLLGVWLALFAAYWLACAAAAGMLGDRDSGAAGRMARRFAWTLVPIAVGYNLAHNFSGLMIQGQNLAPLLSDPFGLGWNLFGTALWHADIGLVDARTIWYVAVAGIVGGHVIAVWLAHRVALREFASPRRAAMACAPLTVLMVAYTALSLTVIAEPIVRFVPEAAGAAAQR